MKRFTLVLTLVLITTMPLFADRVTPETARKAATTFLNNNGAKAAQLNDLTKPAGFTNLYIFTAEQGFVVMAADDCVQPILGYSLTGKFVAEDMPTNVKGWLQGYNDEIQYAIDSKMSASAENAKLWKDLTEGNTKAGKATTIVSSLLQTTWDQNPGYNDLCPYDNNAGELTVTGCVATAMAQIMKYWEYPNHGVGSHSYTPSAHPEYGLQSVNYGATSYNWADMPLDHANAEIAKLMYHCGVSVDMDYDLASNGGSGAPTAYVANALQAYYNYQPCTYKERSDYQNSWVSMLKTELDASRPLQYSGRGTGGHSFVCCGYDSQNNFYFNWGWSGRNDGFYSLSSLIPGSGGAGGSNYNFTNDQAAIFGIQPVECAAGEPSNLTYTRDGFTVTLNWTAGEDAASYNIYRNNVLLGNTTYTTFTDNINYGNYSYFVKSKDANGSQSLPTNTITLSIEPVPTNLTATLNGNNADLTWEEPVWSAPQTGDEMLTYGDGNNQGGFGVTNARGYYGHRYPVSMLNANKVLYKVSFYAAESGNFAVYIYSANSGNSKPQTLLLTKSVTVSFSGWCDIEFEAEEFIHINNSKDLWVFIYDPEAKQYPMGVEGSTNDDGDYFSAQEANGPSSWIGHASGSTMLIRTYITDDSFQYNLYDNNTLVASELSGTSYSLPNISNNTAHLFTLKTLFNDGETSNSNMAGLAVGNASLTSLSMSANDHMTVTEGSKLTVNGTLNNSVAANLILKNAAQLVNSSDNVQATVEKTISAFTQGEDNGWHLIASPVSESITPSANNGWLTNSYDLYIFDQSENLEWQNYKADAFTTIDNKVGYLYANSSNSTLSFVGTLANTATTTTLVYNGDAHFKGFNLIGNPFPCEAYINRSFYVMNSDGSNFIESSGAIPPCTAVLVQAQNASDNNITFTKNTSKTTSSIVAQLKTADFKGDIIIDQARVNFNENDNLVKYSLNKNASVLYFPQEGNNFAAVSFAGQSEMPLNFKASHNGSYTLSFALENTDVDYLHLIDNMTGADIDLMTSKSYTFKASTNDYASRFRLMFSNCEDAVDDNETFAYYDGSEWIIDNLGTSSLEIVDMLGHVIEAKTIAGRSAVALNLSAGVYIFRLSNGEQVKTQKIVVR